MDSTPQLPDLPPVKLRSYQQEMVDASMTRNVIVAMDTGSGKTHVAIARIRAEIERSRSDKLVWFLSPSVALSQQQAEVLASSLPAYRVRTLVGLDGVDKWTDRRLWDATLANVNVVVGTPAVLADALTHSFVNISRLSLCVFDEAHKATKGHPMNAIMQRFYHPAREQGHDVPHILGLTASPVVNTKHGSLEKIEHNLNAIAVTPKQNRDELEQYVNIPKFETISYPVGHANDLGEQFILCAAIAQKSREYDFSTDPYILELRERDDERARKSLTEVLMKRKTWCSEQIRALDFRAWSLREQLGASVAQWYISSCITKFREGMRAGPDSAFLMPDEPSVEKQHIANIFDTVEQQGRWEQGNHGIGTHITHKVSLLISLLLRNAGASLRGIVFVEQRVQVTALAYLLKQNPEVSQAYRIASFVGTSLPTHHKITVADLVTTGQQQNDLEAFRSGEKNLMIATNVLEEGIDVAACNFVVCFDPPQNLASFVQRRGRARQKESKYFLFAPEDDIRQNTKDWAALESQMKQTYMDDTRQLADHPDGEAALDEMLYRVSNSGALLTLENAKSHLYHFCSVGTSQASNYVDLRPEFDTGQDALSRLWTSCVTLPSFVHPDVRNANSSRSWHSESAAIKDAAFQAYIALHKAGLVNDNLLPLAKDYGPDAGQQHLDQHSIIKVSNRQSSWQMLWAKNRDLDPDWSSNLVTIVLGNETIVQTLAWTPSHLPHLQPFKLYWNKSATYEVLVETTNEGSKPLPARELLMLRRCTDVLIRSIRGNIMLNGCKDFPILFSPVDIDSLKQWLDDVEGFHWAADVTANNELWRDRGIVKVANQQGRLFILQGFDHSQDDDGNLGQQVVVTGFPKRRDFLHPVTESNKTTAYTAKQLFPLKDCTVEKLPTKFSLFAAFIPSIMHRIEIAFLIQNLQRTLLEPVRIKDSTLVQQAITSAATGEATDYNRLEYLGDTILKHCTELQVMSQHTNWPEAYLGLERDRIVRNSNLAQAALDAGLDKYMLTNRFTGSKWRPPYISDILSQEPGSREISSKTCADVVEALIGAAFVDGGLDKALTCIKTLLPLEQWNKPETCFDILIEDLVHTSYKNLDVLERLVGHHFRHPTLLVEAVTHASFPYNQTGLSYERLEFLGDSVLDMVLTPKLFAHARQLKHWELHRIHSALVNSHFLGYFCMRYGIEVESHNVVEAAATLGSSTWQHEIHKSARTVHLHDFLRAGHTLMSQRQQALAAFASSQHIIEHALCHNRTYPWTELVALNPPKFFCDLVEAVLGALFIDTRGDLGICEAFVGRLGVLEYMQRVLAEHVEATSPKERLGMLTDRYVVEYLTSRRDTESGEVVFDCMVKVGDVETVTVTGSAHRAEAEVRAAHQACEILEQQVAPTFGGKEKRPSGVYDDTSPGHETADEETQDMNVLKVENGIGSIRRRA